MKNFKVLSIENANETGTSLQGYINATYSQLLEVLGKPTYDEPSGDDKVQLEWVIEFKGNIFTIYDWKTGSREYTENELTEFNVGGTTSAADFIQEIESQINK
jgi:hypothetical protein